MKKLAIGAEDSIALAPAAVFGCVGMRDKMCVERY